MSKWTVWAVEDDEGTTPECFDIAGYGNFEAALKSAKTEIEENGAAICAYITSESGAIWLVIDGITQNVAYLPPGVKHWRDALEAVAA